MLGNWREFVFDLDADGPDGNGSDNTEGRTHDMANELKGQDVDSGGAPNLAHTFDHAGNMRTHRWEANPPPTPPTTPMICGIAW